MPLRRVQPVPELSELTQHCGLDETDVELNGDNVQSGTLHRSGSRLFKNTMGWLMGRANRTPPRDAKKN
uniref:Uncharacterized protein n=1 Tax=Timema cristinae TaxID=61476 RepID=A0A7R9H483_TIMCR|nr:unnamed protein product [Timema cristinae]